MNYDPRDWYWQIAGRDDVWSSNRGGFVPADDATYQAWLSAGNAATAIGSQDEMIEVMRAANVPPFHKVSTFRIVRRLEEDGRIDAADQALATNRALFRRFYTAGTIPADDVSARAFLGAIGADADSILAPE